MNSAHPERQRLYHLADGDLPPDEATALRLHLQSCPACATHFAELEMLGRALALDLSPPAPLSPERFLAALAEEKPPLPRWLGWAATAAGLLLAQFFLWPLWPRSGADLLALGTGLAALVKGIWVLSGTLGAALVRHAPGTLFIAVTAALAAAAIGITSVSAHSLLVGEEAEGGLS